MENSTTFAIELRQPFWKLSEYTRRWYVYKAFTETRCLFN